MASRPLSLTRSPSLPSHSHAAPSLTTINNHKNNEQEQKTNNQVRKGGETEMKVLRYKMEQLGQKTTTRSSSLHHDSVHQSSLYVIPPGVRRQVQARRITKATRHLRNIIAKKIDDETADMNWKERQEYRKQQRDEERKRRELDEQKKQQQREEHGDDDEEEEEEDEHGPQGKQGAATNAMPSVYSQYKSYALTKLKIHDRHSYLSRQNHTPLRDALDYVQVQRGMELLRENTRVSQWTGLRVDTRQLAKAKIRGRYSSSDDDDPDADDDASRRDRERESRAAHDKTSGDAGTTTTTTTTTTTGTAAPRSDTTLNWIMDSEQQESARKKITETGVRIKRNMDAWRREKEEKQRDDASAAAAAAAAAAAHARTASTLHHAGLHAAGSHAQSHAQLHVSQQHSTPHFKSRSSATSSGSLLRSSSAPSLRGPLPKLEVHTGVGVEDVQFREEGEQTLWIDTKTALELTCARVHFHHFKSRSRQFNELFLSTDNQQIVWLTFWYFFIKFFQDPADTAELLERILTTLGHRYQAFVLYFDHHLIHGREYLMESWYDRLTREERERKDAEELAEREAQTPRSNQSSRPATPTTSHAAPKALWDPLVVIPEYPMLTLEQEKKLHPQTRLGTNHQKERFLTLYPLIVTDAIYELFVSSFPESAHFLTSRFRSRVEFELYHILTGMELSDITLRKTRATFLMEVENMKETQETSTLPSFEALFHFNQLTNPNAFPMTSKFHSSLIDPLHTALPGSPLIASNAIRLANDTSAKPTPLTNHARLGDGGLVDHLRATGVSPDKSHHKEGSDIQAIPINPLLAPSPTKPTPLLGATLSPSLSSPGIAGLTGSSPIPLNLAPSASSPLNDSIQSPSARIRRQREKPIKDSLHSTGDWSRDERERREQRERLKQKNQDDALRLEKEKRKADQRIKRLEAEFSVGSAIPAASPTSSISLAATTHTTPRAETLEDRIAMMAKDKTAAIMSPSKASVDATQATPDNSVLQSMHMSPSTDQLQTPPRLKRSQSNASNKAIPNSPLFRSPSATLLRTPSVALLDAPTLSQPPELPLAHLLLTEELLRHKGVLRPPKVNIAVNCLSPVMSRTIDRTTPQSHVSQAGRVLKHRIPVGDWGRGDEDNNTYAHRDVLQTWQIDPAHAEKERELLNDYLELHTLQLEAEGFKTNETREANKKIRQAIMKKSQSTPVLPPAHVKQQSHLPPAHSRAPQYPAATPIKSPQSTQHSLTSSSLSHSASQATLPSYAQSQAQAHPKTPQPISASSSSSSAAAAAHSTPPSSKSPLSKVNTPQLAQTKLRSKSPPSSSLTAPASAPPKSSNHLSTAFRSQLSPIPSVSPSVAASAAPSARDDKKQRSTVKKTKIEDPDASWLTPRTKEIIEAVEAQAKQHMQIQVQENQDQTTK